MGFCCGLSSVITLISFKNVMCIHMLMRTFISRIIIAFTGVYTTLYLYNHLNTQEMGFSVTVYAITTILTLHLSESKKVRVWISNHPWLLLGSFIVVDNGTEIMLLYYPLIKLIGDNIAGATIVQLIDVWCTDVINRFWENDAETRTVFSIKKHKYAHLGMLVGGVLGMIVDLSIEWAVIINVTLLSLMSIWMGYIMTSIEKYLRAA